MDLWDLTKLIFRRWYFSVPMLVVTLTGTLLVSRTVHPDYTAVGHLQMIPPASPTPRDADPKTTGPKNPWLDLGIPALGQAVVLKVSDLSVVKSLASQGYAENYLVSIDYSSTFFSIQVTGTSAQQATATVRKVTQLLTDEVLAQQRQFGVADRDEITTLALDQGDKVTTVTSKLKRVIIVAAGISLLSTIGFTIGLDALLRRRSARTATRAAVLTATVGPIVVEPAPEPAIVGQPRRLIGPSALWANGAFRNRPSVGADVSEAGQDGAVYRSQMAGGGTGVPEMPGVGEHNGLPRRPTAVEPSLTADNPSTGPDDEPEAQTQIVTSEATIVLPVNYDDWTRSSRGKRP